jgi:hypothetical protein
LSTQSIYVNSVSIEEGLKKSAHLVKEAMCEELKQFVDIGAFTPIVNEGGSHQKNNPISKIASTPAANHLKEHCYLPLLPLLTSRRCEEVVWRNFNEHQTRYCITSITYALALRDSMIMIEMFFIEYFNILMDLDATNPDQPFTFPPTQPMG